MMTICCLCDKKVKDKDLFRGLWIRYKPNPDKHICVSCAKSLKETVRVWGAE